MSALSVPVLPSWLCISQSLMQVWEQRSYPQILVASSWISNRNMWWELSLTYFYSFPPEAHFFLQYRDLLLEADYKWISKGQRESGESKLRKKAYLIGMGIKQAAVHSKQTFNPRLYIHCSFGNPHEILPLPPCHTHECRGGRVRTNIILGWAICQ